MIQDFWYSSGAAGGGGDAGDPIGQSLRFRATSQSAGPYLHRTGFDNNGNVWTFSCWMKGWGPADATAQYNAPIFSWHNNTGSQTVDELAIFGNYPSTGRHEINYYFQGSAAGNSYSNEEFNDPSAWYHVVWRSAGTNQVTLWINNRQVSSWRQDSAVTSQPFINKNQTCSIGARAPGNTSPSGNQYHGDGYLAQVYFVDGTAQDPDQFGRYNDNGIWVPVNYTGAYGDNGFHLDFSDASDIGEDSSGNNNDFTAVGFELADDDDPDFDMMTDSPTQNYATLNNQISTAGANINDGNLEWSASSFEPANQTITLPTTGSYYFEATISASNCRIGITQVVDPEDRISANENIAVWLQDFGAGSAANATRTPNSTIASGAATMIATPCVLGVEWDADNGTFEVFRNGVSQYTVGTITLDGPYYIQVDRNGTDATTVKFNFGQQPFQHRPGTLGDGTELQTQNLAAAAITDGRDHFQAIIGPGDGVASGTAGSGPWSSGTTASNGFDSSNPAANMFDGNTGTFANAPGGTGTTVITFAPDVAIDIDGLDVDVFTPGFTGQTAALGGVTTALSTASSWVALNTGTATEISATSPLTFSRDTAGEACRICAIRVNNNVLRDLSILANARRIFPNGLYWIKDRVNTSQHQLFDSIRGDANARQTPAGKVQPAFTPTGNSSAFCWTAPDEFNDTTADIDSTGRRNVDGGFSIRKYAGNQSSTQSIAHGLGRTPAFIVVVRESTGSANSSVWHHDLASVNGRLVFETDASVSNANAVWDRAPDNTFFYIGNNNLTNRTGENFTAYVWAEIPGYSDFGSYSGANDPDGNFIYTGFRPAFVMIKRTSGAGMWTIRDTASYPHNPVAGCVRPDFGGPEISTDIYRIDILSNGFKLRNSSATGGGGGGDYVYFAFAENPFGGSNTVPTTAR